MGRNPAILRKYYKSHIDEHTFLKENFKNLILDINRAKGVSEAINKNYDCVILDDGFQDYKIKKDINIICFNENQLLGNGYILPAGPLRESLGSLKKANIILINGKKNINFEKKLLNINNGLKFFYSQYRPVNLSKFINKKLLAIAGIGNPNNFFKLLIENKLDLRKKIVFPDHYDFKIKEIKDICDIADQYNYQIVMTEKDYQKIKKFKLRNIEFLKVELEISNKENFLKTIEKIYD